MKRTAVLPIPALETHARTIAAMFTSRPDPKRIAALLGPTLAAALPVRRLRDLLSGYFARCGACVDIQPLTVSIPNWGRFELRFAKGFTATMELRVEPDDLSHLEGLNLGEPVMRRQTLPDVKVALDALAGRTGWQLAWLDGDELRRLGGARDTVPLALGSSSKLYILGALVQAVRDGRLAWTDALQLQERYSAIPTGVLQEWPLGTSFTVQSLAGMMISLSDNTATEHLMFALGRERVEAFQAVAGHARPDLNVPFLSIMEMLALKDASSDGVALRYLAAPAAQRRAMLDALEPHGIEDVMVSARPRHVTDIEWFASPADMCRCLQWLLRSGDRTALDLLTINSGTDFPPRCWPWVGFKGGGEAGVLHAAYLLQDAESHWYALSVGWNRDDAATDDKTLFSLVRDLADLAPALRKGTAPQPRRSLLQRLLGWR